MSPLARSRSTSSSTHSSRYSRSRTDSSAVRVITSSCSPARGAPHRANPWLFAVVLSVFLLCALWFIFDAWLYRIIAARNGYEPPKATHTSGDDGTVTLRLEPRDTDCNSAWLNIRRARSP